jgi:hypothetical protein
VVGEVRGEVGGMTQRERRREKEREMSRMGRVGGEREMLTDSCV